MIPPLVSVCIPTYNGAKYLEEALDSVEKQTYKNIEIIISDDCSSDNTLEICENFKIKTKFPVYIYSHTPSGIGANWNHSIEKAGGEWIKFLFQDDLLEPDCIKTMLETATENNLQIVVSERKIIDGNSKEINGGEWFGTYGNLLASAGIKTTELFRLSKDSFRSLNFGAYSVKNIIGEPCVSMFSKKIFEDLGGFSTTLKQLLDYEFWLRALEKHDIGIIPRKLVSFRYHDLQTSSINSGNNIDEGQQIRELLFSKFFWQIDRRSRSSYLRKKYPLIENIATMKEHFFGFFQK